MSNYNTLNCLKYVLFSALITGFFLVCGCIEDKPIDVENISANLTCLADDKEQNGSVIEALSLYDAAIRLNSSDTALWLKTAELLAKESMNTEAVIGFTHVLRLDPENSSAWIGRGEIYKREGKLKDEYDDFKNEIR